MNSKEVEQLKRLSYSSPSSQQLICSGECSRHSVSNRRLQGGWACPKPVGRGDRKEVNHSRFFIFLSQVLCCIHRSGSEGFGSINCVQVLIADSSSNMPEPGFWRHICQGRRQLLNLILAHRIMTQCIVTLNWEQYTIFLWLPGATNGGEHWILIFRRWLIDGKRRHIFQFWLILCPCHKFWQ